MMESVRELEEGFVGEEWGGPRERGKRGHLAQPPGTVRGKRMSDAGSVCLSIPRSITHSFLNLPQEQDTSSGGGDTPVKSSPCQRFLSGP